MVFYSLVLLIVAVDQVLKYLIHRSMYVGESIPLINGVLNLTYVRNPGAAFSLFIGFSSYLIIVGLAVVLVVIYFHHKLPRYNFPLQLALAFVLGGSLGNLVDRIFRSYVIDYIDIVVWPVFNFADIMINMGVILILFKLFKKEEKRDASYSV